MRDRMLRRRRPLIASPLEWQLTAAPVPHPVIPVLAERGGTQLQTPRATLLVDSREQHPFNFARFREWFAGIEKRALPLGDYAIAGLEDICTVERKDLSDLVHSVHCRPRCLSQATPAHGSVSTSAAGNYEHAESD